MPTRSLYDDLASLYAPVAVVVVILVFGFVAYALARSRRRGPADAGLAPGEPENNVAEGTYVAVLGLVTAGLVTASFLSFDKVGAATSRASGAAVRVNVDAAKWRWRFVYPAAGVSSVAGLVVPADRPIRFVARSADVLHDFWVPDVRFQRQVWPDRPTRWTLSFPRGVHDGVCAWFCGLQHDQMRFIVRAVGDAEFRRWLAARSGAGRG